MEANINLDGIRAATQAVRDFTAAWDSLPQEVREAIRFGIPRRKLDRWKPSAH